jgi:hypothetical protein
MHNQMERMILNQSHQFKGKESVELTLTTMPKYDENGELKPVITEYTIASNEIKIERKTFALILKKNHCGTFLRIKEDTRSTIMIPSTGLGEFQKALTELMNISEVISEINEQAE